MASLAHPIRILIVSELESCPLNPSGFRELHPAYDLALVRGHFRSLEALGCIERFNQDSRVLFRPARWAMHFSVAELEELGESSSHYTTSICISYADRIAEAISANTFSSRPDGRFMWSPIYLDERSWRVAVKVTDALYRYSLHLGMQSAKRHAVSTTEIISLTTGFACIASPLNSRALPIIPPMTYGIQPESNDATYPAVNRNLAQALNHPLRIRIMAELKKGPMAPAEIRKRADGASLESVSNHCRRLERLGMVDGARCIDDKRSVVYRLKPLSLFKPQTYASLPFAIRRDVDSVSAATYIDRIADSILAGTIKERLESHLTWTGVKYDGQALGQLASAFDATFRFVLFLQEQSKGEMEDRVPVTLGYGCFESAPGSVTASADRLTRMYRKGSTSKGRAREFQWIEEIVRKLG